MNRKKSQSQWETKKQHINEETPKAISTKQRQMVIENLKNQRLSKSKQMKTIHDPDTPNTHRTKSSLCPTISKLTNSLLSSKKSIVKHVRQKMNKEKKLSSSQNIAPPTRCKHISCKLSDISIHCQVPKKAKSINQNIKKLSKISISHTKTSIQNHLNEQNILSQLLTESTLFTQKY